MRLDELKRAVAAFADAEGAESDPIAAPIAGLSVARSRRPTALTAVLYQPFYCLVLQGAKESGDGGRSVTFGAGQSLVVSHDRPTLSRIVRASPDAPYLALGLALDPAIVRELAEAAGPDLPDPAWATQAAPVSVGTTTTAELDAMARLFGLIGRPAASRVLAPLIVREVHFHLLMAGHGAMLRGLARQDSHASRIAQVLGAMRRDFAAPVRVADPARSAGMSVSAFHDHFRAFTGTTPLQFQKQLRLMEARRLMVDEGRGVARAAFAVGYESSTQFSRDYARKFGIAPSRDRAGASVAAQ